MSFFKKNVRLQTVSFVDLELYLGTWYEIARYTKWFERDVSNVSATYSIENNHIKVVNKGLKNGLSKIALGKAFVVPNSGNAKLRVQFHWPFKGDYWIIHLDKDYKWSVVSNRKKTTLWILSRLPYMNNYLYNSIIDKLRLDGFNVSNIERL